MHESSNSKFFYGWIIVFVAALSLVVSNGLSIHGIPVFYKPIQNDLVNSGAVAPDKIQSVYGLAPAITSLLSGLLAPLAGFLLQKLNARKMMMIGCGVLGLGLLLYSQATTPNYVYAAHALLGAALNFIGVLTCVVLVSDWFQRRRGTALGIVLTGTSFGGVLISLVSAPLIERYGWRTAMILASLIIWIILLPAIVFLVKNRPADLGLQPDGEENIEPSREQSKIENRKSKIPGMTLNEALGKPIFWIFSVFAALIFYAIFVVTQQLNLYLQGSKINFSLEQASFVQSLLFFFSIAGKFSFGFLSDRFRAQRVMLLSAALMFSSTLAFLHFNNQTVYFFAVLFGLTYGGTFVLLQLLAANYFGSKEYGKILGAVTFVETIGGALGTFITGKIADADGGDYSRAFYGTIIVTGLALALAVLLSLMYEKRRALS